MDATEAMAAFGDGRAATVSISFNHFFIPKLCLMKYMIGLVAMLLPILCGAQSLPLKALSIGDVVPDVEINNIINYKTSTAKLSDFKGKLIILDFWSSWCSSCIALFPHLDSLQRAWDDDLQIILVNTKSIQYKDDAPKIKKILSRVNERTGKPVSLPVVYNSQEFDSYFPCIILPHEVWITPDGKVAAITSADELTSGNITRLLNGSKVHMRLKKDAFDVDVTKPLFINGNGEEPQIKYRSLITGYLNGVAGGSGIREESGRVTGLYSINQSLFSLTKLAYNREIPFSNNRIVLDVKDVKNFKIADTDTAGYHHQYCYELIVPGASDSILFSDMQIDLHRYYNIAVKREIRKMNCLVVSDGLKKEYVAGKESFEIDNSASNKYIYNYPAAGVVKLLNFYSSIPLIDETTTTSKVCIDLPDNINDTSQLKAAFNKAGLQVTEEDRELEVIVITDK
jgi:thiol-disulfide isomerase/thioredoxin